jgi:murein L,D-transpeptidase YcbB/YkuD
MKFFVLLSSFLICLLFSCQKKAIPVKSKNPNYDSIATVKADSIRQVKRERRKNFPDANKFKLFLEPAINNTSTSISGATIYMGKDFVLLDTLTLKVYEANNYKGFWNDSAKCHHIIRLLNDSRYDGLLPKDYSIPLLDTMFKECFLGKRKNDTLYWKLELAVTKNYLHYLNHLRFGKTNPEEIFKDWDYVRDPHLPHTPSEFSRLLTQNPDTLVGEFRPQYQMYNLLRSVLYKVDSMEKDTMLEWDAIPYIGKDLKLGDTSWVIVKVKHRLLSVGLISEDPATNVFDQDLLASLNYFQQHVGLTPNGTIDKTTIFKLNFTLEEIKNVARVNMERCRWLLKGELPDYYIVVNIADYYLRIYKHGKEVYKTKVVVGATNKETPSFHSKMTTIEFNPHWTVPISISGNEILPKLKTDPNYLSRNNMELLQGDSVVQITDFTPYSKNYFPFVIRQKPGEDNSLGRVKFIFPNPYSVYFHDTPAKSLFEKDIRAFSHGCVRIHKPLELAAYLLADQKITPKYINEIVEGGKNTVIGLKTRIPVFVTYWTCFSDEKNQIFFFKDIYGRDKLILKELNK